MKIFNNLNILKKYQKSLIAIGNFDGAHIGHQKVFRQAKRNAKLIVKKTKCDAVKIESNNKNFKIIKEIIKANIPVMGHIGYTPQFKNNFKVEGKKWLQFQRKTQFFFGEISHTGITKPKF